MFALPNIEVEEPIELDGMALATIADPRIQELATQHPRFSKYLDSFRSEFNYRINPSIIIRRDDTPDLYRTVDALAGFRDAIALSILPYVWADFLRYGHPPELGYSDSFSIYPWMLDKNYQYVVMRSQAQWGLDEVKKLKPQSIPGVTPRRLIRRNIDRPMLAALLKRWPIRYSTAEPAWEDRALFRSLNMANAAARLPANAEGTEYDIGRCISLWVSAFEILVHDGYSDASYVYKNFDETDWNLTECRKTIYEVEGHKPGQTKRNLACWIYGKLNKSRNDFLHGNAIADKALSIPESGRYLPHYAPVLYRMALTARLGLKWTEEVPDPANRQHYERYFDFRYFQGEMEAALATALVPPKQ
jgi:hypothetical protein